MTVLRSDIARRYIRRAIYIRSVVEASRSNANNVRSVESFVSRLDLELDFLPFREGFEPVHRDGREMHEDILATLLLNEAIAFGVIEPLHLPSGHASCLLRSESILHCEVLGKSTRLAGPI